MAGKRHGAASGKSGGERERHDEPTGIVKIILASSSPRRRDLLNQAGIDFTVRTPATPVDETLDPDEQRDPVRACESLAERKAGALVEELLDERRKREPADAGDRQPGCSRELLDERRKREPDADAGNHHLSRSRELHDKRCMEAPAADAPAADAPANTDTGASANTGADMSADTAGGMLAVIGADTMVVKGTQIFGKPKDAADAARMLRELSGCTHDVITAVSIWTVPAAHADGASVDRQTFADVSHVTFRNLTDEDVTAYLDKGESSDKAGAYAIQGEGASLVDHYDGDLDTIIGLPVGRLLREAPLLATSATSGNAD